MYRCSADEDIDSKFPSNVVIDANGTCDWVPLGLFISSCAIDIRWFPFDDQRCKLKFGSWTYDGNSINMTILGGTEGAVSLDTYQPSGEWKLIGQSVGWSIRRIVTSGLGLVAGTVLWGPGMT